MLNIAVCDDMPQELAFSKAAAEQYFKDHTQMRASITCFDHSLALLEHIDKNGGFDIMLLDICMPGLNGTDVAKEVRRRNEKTEIVFLTASEEFAVAAFSLKAAHYLVKPFTQSQFEEAMQRACAALGGTVPRRLPLKLLGGGMKTVDACQIVCVESCLHEQQISLETNEVFAVRESMVNLLAQLEVLLPGQFLSPYKGYIVNLEAVRSVEPDGIKLHNGKDVPIARRSYRELLERYFTYMFGEKT